MSFLVKDSSVSWGGLTQAVYWLLCITTGVFVLQLVIDHQTATPFTRGWVTQHFGLWPAAVVERGHVWQMFTYMFLHSDRLLAHIIFNMLALVLMGPETERSMGARHFTLMYLMSGILGGLAFTMTSYSKSCVGASGAVFGILGAFVAMHPNRHVYIIFLPMVPIKAWVIAVIMGLIQIILLLFHHGGSVAYTVHIAGGIAGYLYAMTIFQPAKVPWRRAATQRVEPGSFTNQEGERVLTDPELDILLDKIASEGMGSLTRREQALLRRTSENRAGK